MRVDWENVSPPVRLAIEKRLGGTVVEASTQRGGFSPGVAARLRLSDGRRFFVKAVSEAANPDTPHIHRNEARVVAALPPSAPVPRFLWTFDDEGWVVLCFEDVDARHPSEPWTEADLALVVATLKRMAVDLTPSPLITSETAREAFARSINGWWRALDRREDRLDPWCAKHLARLSDLESLAPGAVDGDTLLHFDIRADNLLIAGDRVYVIDWPWARRGAAFVDWLAMAPSVEMQGGPSCEAFLRKFDLSGVSEGAIDAALCSLAGFFVVGALEPPPRGIPTVRAFQAAQGAVATRWLRERTGWK
jgi:aminoglycoside phosphotransferase (APT) family kinase protein